MSGTPDVEIEITDEMIQVGWDCLEEFVNPGGLENSASYVAVEVYRAMERCRRGIPEDRSDRC